MSRTTLLLGLWLSVLAGGGCSSVEIPKATVATDEMPRELDKVSLPPYVVEPPDILIIESARWLGDHNNADRIEWVVEPNSEGKLDRRPVTIPGDLSDDRPLRGEFLVRADGTVSLGNYGDLYVAGYTLDEVKNLVLERLTERIKQVYPQDIYVDVVAYNSKVFYVISDGAGSGEQVVRLPSTGNETVLDALSQVGGLSSVSSKQRIWIARPTSDPCNPQILPVDWRKIVESGVTETNYQIFPGDRIYVQSDPLIKLDTMVAKVTAPVERVLGNILLWNITVKRLEGQNTGTGLGF